MLSSDGRTLKVRCSVSSFSFSAHADYSQTSGFLDALAPADVVLCHGNTNEMERLQNQGVSFIGEPKMEAGWRSVFAYDPDGTLFALEQNISAPQAESIDDMIWIDPATF